MIFDEDGTQKQSTDVTDLLVDEFNISLKTTGGDASWINGKNECHTRSIHNTFIAALLYSNQHENNVCSTAETSAEVYRYKIHSTLDTASSHFACNVKHIHTKA